MGAVPGERHVRPATGAAGLRYDNNIALQEAGRCRMVVTRVASPLTGTGGDESCEFALNLTRTRIGEPGPAG